jgi:ribosomal protein S18 acetylase RimI-like enzyme
MSLSIRTATDSEAAKLWSAVAADRLFENAEQYRAYHAAGPWRVRVTPKGEAALLGPWREHLGVLAIRGVWSQERHVADFARDAAEQAHQHGFTSVLSPLLPDLLLGGYLRAGMRVVQPIVAIQGNPGLIMPAEPPIGVRIRPATEADIIAVARVDGACFEEFWRYGVAEFRDLARTERMTVAEAKGGAIIGYTLATVVRGAATLSRLGTAPQARRCGVGRALLAEVASWTASRGAVTISLCTQEENSASRAMYASAGLTELPERYALAFMET